MINPKNTKFTNHDIQDVFRLFLEKVVRLEIHWAFNFVATL